ncbi:MAG: DUF371 domain-containing protein [Acidilobaceae archaeon]
MKVLDSRWLVFRAEGHPNVSARHETTIEVTREDYLTPRGDCIIGVKSELSARDLPEWFKEEARRGSLIVAVFCAESVCDSVVGRGSPEMSFADDKRIVLRRSAYVGPETVMIKASRAAAHLSRELVARLSRGAELEVFLAAIPVKRNSD